MSQSASNAVDRILSGKPLKFTITIHKPDGGKIEFQSDKPASLDWNNESRSLWIITADYPKNYVCEHERGMVIIQEENPKP